jgi:hypothetical protein
MIRQHLIFRLFFLLFFIFSVNTLSGQVVDQKFRLAESYENGGDIPSALRLYEEIYTTNKQDRYFQPIIRILKQQNR